MTFRLLVLLSVALALSGCVTTQLGDQAVRADLPADAPGVEEILADLAANDASIHTFRAAGTFTLESPKLEATQVFRGGSIRFRRPADLFVRGNHRVTNMTLFKLISVGDEFLMEFPTSREQSFYQLEGEDFEDVPFSVSPSDIAREMFLPEDWERLSKREAQLTAYDQAAHAATIALWEDGRVRRELQVARVNPESPGWAVVKNTRFTDEGQVLAVTTLRDYHVQEGIRFPAYVEAVFPTEETRMVFEMRNIRLNVGIPDEDFDIRGRARELGLSTF